MENANKIIQNYRLMYESYKSPKISRLPLQLKSEPDTQCRLTAALSMEVENLDRIFCVDHNTEDKIFRVAKWLHCSKKRGLLLMGPLGNGKTVMLKAIRDIFRPYSSFGDTQDIYDYYKRGMGMQFWNDRLLLIDDLGGENIRCMNYGEEHHPISRILLHRYDHQLTTIMATNLGLSEIKERYGDRVVDRMYETYEVIKYERKSYRRYNDD